MIEIDGTIDELTGKRDALWSLEFKLLDDRSFYFWCTLVWPILFGVLAWFNIPPYGVFSYIVGGAMVLIFPVLWLHTWRLLFLIQRDLSRIDRRIEHLEAKFPEY